MEAVYCEFMRSFIIPPPNALLCAHFRVPSRGDPVPLEYVPLCTVILFYNLTLLVCERKAERGEQPGTVLLINVLMTA